MSTWGKHNKSPMSGWVQHGKSMLSWLHSILTAQIEVTGRPPLLKWHHRPTLEDFDLLTKTSFIKKCTQFNILPSDLLHTIDTWHLGIVHHNNLKPVLAQLNQHNPVLRDSNSYKLKYLTFDYYINFDVIQYMWVDRRLGPHTPDRDRTWGKIHRIKHEPI